MAGKAKAGAGKMYADWAESARTMVTRGSIVGPGYARRAEDHVVGAQDEREWFERVSKRVKSDKGRRLVEEYGKDAEKYF